MPVFLQTMFCCLVIAIVFALCPVVTAYSTSGLIDGSNQQRDQQDVEEQDVEEQESEKRPKKSKIRFSEWDQGIAWLFSTKKWEPVIAKIRQIVETIFNPTEAEESEQPPRILQL